MVEAEKITTTAVFTEQIYNAIVQYQGRIGVEGQYDANGNEDPALGTDRKFSQLPRKAQNELYTQLLQGLDTYEITQNREALIKSGGDFNNHRLTPVE